MSNWKIIPALALVLTLGCLNACGDSPELKMQQAKIALANGKPDEALTLTTSVLEEQPDNFEALKIKTRSQLMLAKLTAAKRSIDKMLEAEPDDETVHRTMIDWTWMRMRNLLSQSEFATDTKLQVEFAEAMTVGMEQADWLAARESTVADSLYFRARYTHMDVQRIRVEAHHSERALSGMNLEEDVDDQTEREADRREFEVEARLTEAEGYLRAALDADSEHYDAVEMLIALLLQREQWPDLWDLAERYSVTEGIPDTLFDHLASALLVVPSSLKTTEQRLDVGWKLQKVVNEDLKSGPTWQIASARLHMVAKEYDRAQELLEIALQSRGGDMDARYLLAQSLYGQERYPEAIAVLDDLKRSAPRSARVHALFGLAKMKTGELILAKEALRLATELNPQDPMAREGFLALMVQEGHIAEAKGDVDVYYNLNPTQPRAIRFKLQFELANANREEVGKLLRSVEKIKPMTPAHLAILIDGYMAMQDHSKAVRYSKKLVKEVPDELASHLRLAEAMLMQGKDDQVKDMLVKLREGFPDAVTVDQMLGRLYLQRQSFDRATELLERVIAKEPSNIPARLLLAQAYASLSLTDEALDQLDKVLEQDPGNVSAHSLAARVYQYTGKGEKANSHLDQIDESSIDERTNPALLAQLHLKRDNKDEAMAVCNRAVASGNTDPVLRLILAAIYRDREEHAQVETHLLALVHAQPKNPQAFALLSRFYLEQNEVKKGLVELQALQTLNEPLARLSQASLLKAIGQPDAALIKLEPMLEGLIRNRTQMALSIADSMAKIHLSQDDKAKAYKVYEPLVDADLFVGEVELRRIDLIGAETHPDKLVRRLDLLAETLTPEQWRLRYQVMRRYLGLKRPDRAMELVDGWIKDRPGIASLRRWKGDLLLGLGKPQMAIEQFRVGVEIMPDNVGLRMRLAASHIGANDYVGAEQVYLDATKLDAGARIAALTGMGQMFLHIGLNQMAAETFDELERISRPRDPRVAFAMARALAALGKDEQAMNRLRDIPNYAPQYPGAQILLARIEQRRNMVDEAETRLKTLARDSRYTGAMIRELIEMRTNNQTTEDLVMWSDGAMSMDGLPDSTKLIWLNVRVYLASVDRDWPRVLQTIEQMIDISPDNPQLIVARILVQLQLGKVEQSRILYRSTPGMSSSLFAPLLANSLNESAVPRSDRPALVQYLDAVFRGDLDGARAAANQLAPLRTMYRGDLIELLDRPDIKSKNMTLAIEKLGLALVALQSGLQPLAADLSQQAIQIFPGLAPAYGVHVQALIDLRRPTDAVLGQAQRGMPNGSLTLFLSSLQKKADRDFEGQAEDLTKLLEREADNTHVRYSLTQALHQADRVDEAIALLEEIFNGNGPYKFLAGNDLSYLLAERHPDRLDEAFQIASAAAEMAQSTTPLLDTIGWIEHLRGNNAEALGYLQRAIPGLSGLAEAHYHIGAVYAAVGNTAWASYHLKEAASSSQEQAEVAKSRELLEELGL